MASLEQKKLATNEKRAKNTEVIETRVMNIRVDRGEVPKQSAEKPRLKEGQYPGGSQVEGWTPLRDRTPWSVPAPKVEIPQWWNKMRAPVAELLELVARLPVIYRVAAAVLVVLGGFVLPVLGFWNTPFIAAAILFQTRIGFMDWIVTNIIQPILNLVTAPFKSNTVAAAKAY